MANPFIGGSNMISDNFYSVYKVTDYIDAIKSKTGEIMYLLKGTKRAVLVDTCLGVGNIRSVVENITKLPITVLLSHGHVDHAMGAPLLKTCILITQIKRFILHTHLLK